MTILVVDDEPRLCQTIARSLELHGHRVDTAATHQAAITAATGTPYDVLLLDVNLPDGTGWDVLRDLAAAGNSTPAIIVSAIPPSAARVREFRPHGVLYKPFPMEALLRLIAGVPVTRR